MFLPLQEEAAKVYSRGMQDYADMKQQLLQINVALIGGFSGVAGLIGEIL